MKSHDVVLAEVRAILHLDDLQRLGTGVLQPVAGLLRDAGALAHSDIEDAAPTRYPRLPLNDDPVLAPLAMKLQGEPHARVDRDPLDFVTAPLFQHHVGAPWPDL